MAQQQAKVTPTGWRVIGEAANLLSSTALLQPTPPADPDDVVFAAQFRVKPRMGDPDDAALAAIERVIAGARSEHGVVGRATRFSEATSKFHALRWDTLDDTDRWTAELLWRRVHPAIAGVAITDQVVLGRRNSEATLTVRTWTPGGVAAVRGTVGAGQAKSPVLSSLASALRLGFDGRIAEPRVLQDADVETFVSEVLLGDRRWPVAVLAPTESGEYHVDPAVLSDELLGLAHVYYIDRHQTTFCLSDELGDRRLSCYWGALRIYQPGFSCADDGRSHPLLVGDRVLDPVERAGLAGKLAIANHSRVPSPDTPSQLRDAIELKKPARVAEPAAAFVASTSTMAQAPAFASDVRLSAIERAQTTIADTVRAIMEMNARLMDEVVRLRAMTAVRSANVGGLERRISSLERTVDRHFNPPDPAAPAAEAVAPVEAIDATPDITLVSVVQQASAVHGDALLFLDGAIAAAEDSPYEDVDRVALILDTMAHIARRRQEGALGMSLRETFRDYGMDYRGGISKATPARFLEQYRALLKSGQEVLCDEHIVLGTSYDPRHCLRIYFTSRASGEPRFVISHVGRHFDVSSTT